MKKFAIATVIAAVVAMSLGNVAQAKNLQIPPAGKFQINPGQLGNVKAPNPNQLKPWKPMPQPMPQPGPKGKNYDDGALALGLGLATVGLIAAASQPSYGYADCWYEKHVRFDVYGKKHVKKVRVCE